MGRVLEGRLRLIAALVMLLIAVHGLNILSGGYIKHFGIVPRQLDTLPHIFTAPFIHGGFFHLFNNCLGLAVFSGICLLRSTRYFLTASLFIIVVGGFLVWLFGRPANHIGASGWIFGLWSLAIAQAWFDRSVKNLIIACAVVFFYGGMIFGVLPNQPGVSFESHIFGLVAGTTFAAIMGGRVGLKIERNKK